MENQNDAIRRFIEHVVPIDANALLRDVSEANT